MPASALRPRSTTELIDASVQVLRRHYAALLTISAVFQLPPILINLLGPVGELLSRTLAGVLGAAATGAVVVVVSDSYLGRDVDVGRAMRAARDRFGALFTASFLQGLLIAVGFIALVVPGFIMLAWTFSMPAIVILENRTAGESFARSRGLAQGSVLRICGALLLIGLIVYGLALGVGAGMALLLSLAGAGETTYGLGFGVAWICLYPIIGTIITLLYYDLRIRKEGYDLELMAQELGAMSEPGTVGAQLPRPGTGSRAGS